MAARGHTMRAVVEAEAPGALAPAPLSRLHSTGLTAKGVGAVASSAAPPAKRSAPSVAATATTAGVAASSNKRASLLDRWSGLLGNDHEGTPPPLVESSDDEDDSPSAGHVPQSAAPSPSAARQKLIFEKPACRSRCCRPSTSTAPECAHRNQISGCLPWAHSTCPCPPPPRRLTDRFFLCAGPSGSPHGTSTSSPPTSAHTSQSSRRRKGRTPDQAIVEEGTSKATLVADWANFDCRRGLCVCIFS